jgi:hypothetical protein
MPSLIFQILQQHLSTRFVQTGQKNRSKKRVSESKNAKVVATTTTKTVPGSSRAYKRGLSFLSLLLLSLSHVGYFCGAGYSWPSVTAAIKQSKAKQ